MIFNRMFISAILLSFVIAGSSSPSSPRSRMSLEARIEGRTLVATLENHTDSEVWYWKRGNYWGDSSFHLVLHNQENRTFLVLKYDNLIYGRHQPDTQRILKGNKAEYRFDLDCHGWGEDRKALRDDKYVIASVIMSSEISHESLSSGVFLDRVRFDFPNTQ